MVLTLMLMVPAIAGLFAFAWCLDERERQRSGRTLVRITHR